MELDGGNWSRVNLRNANLEGASFYGFAGSINRGRSNTLNWLDPDYGGSPIRNADLRGANLRRVSFSLSDLSWSDLRGADLRGSFLPEQSEGVRLEGALGPDGRVCGPGSVGRCVVEPRRAQRRRGRSTRSN
jgi:uncharacterized protein YjbI with pentapeptide repeats